MIRRLTLAAGLCALLPWSAHAQLADKKALTIGAAKEIAAAARAEAVKNQWKVVITIIDEGGTLLYLERMDNVQTASVDVSIAKARSAAAFRRPTKSFADRVAGGAVNLLALPGAVPVEGGVPILFDGQVIGAIGVSGMTSEQDGVIAQAGADAIAKIK